MGITWKLRCVLGCFLNFCPVEAIGFQFKLASSQCFLNLICFVEDRASQMKVCLYRFDKYLH